MEQRKTPFTILLVDDDTDLVEALTQDLSKRYLCVTAQNGEDALNLIAKQKFDAIVSDIRMPKMDGVRLLKTLRSRGDTTRFLFITGFGSHETEIDAIRHGAIDFIRKPFSLADLDSTLNTLLTLKTQET